MKVVDRERRVFQAEGVAFWEDILYKVTHASREHRKGSVRQKLKRVQAKMAREWVER